MGRSKDFISRYTLPILMAIFTTKQILDFVSTEPHIMRETDLKDIRTNQLIFTNPRSDRFRAEMLVVRTAVDAENFTKQIESMLEPELVNGV